MVGRPGRRRTRLTWFFIGALLGGASTGGALALLGLGMPELPGSVATLILLLAATLLLATDLGLWRLRLPQNARQVRVAVLEMRDSVGAAMFGFELGTGARTYMTGTAPYLAVLTVALVGGGWEGLLGGVGFGVGRGLLPLDRELRSDRESWDIQIRTWSAHVLPVASLAGTLLTGVALLFARS